MIGFSFTYYEWSIRVFGESAQVELEDELETGQAGKGATSIRQPSNQPSDQLIYASMKFNQTLTSNHC